MHEMKVTEAKKVAQKMMNTEEASRSIQECELGENVLTLHEVIQTFEKDSPMYNIKLPRTELNSSVQEECRTVVLKKNSAEIDGKSKLIIMIRDVSDRVRLEQEQIKKKK